MTLGTLDLNAQQRASRTAGDLIVANIGTESFS